MLRIRSFYLGAAAALTVSVVPALAAAPVPANPFAQESTLPFHAPDFSKIKDSDYQPAFDEGMKRNLAEIEKIADNPAPATFDNTIVAMEKSGRMLDRVANAFFGVVSANTDDALDKVQAVEAPKLAAHQDAIYLNPKLFARVKAVYEKRDTLKSDPEAVQLVTLYYQQFVHAGANLSDADKTKLKDLNKKMRRSKPRSSRSFSPEPRPARSSSTTRPRWRV